LMMGGEFLNQAGYSRKLVPRESVWNDEHSAMGALVIKKLNRKPNKIVSVSGNQASFSLGGKIKLILIRYFAHANLMGAECIDSASSKYFGNLRAEVFIQVKFHEGDRIKG